MPIRFYSILYTVEKVNKYHGYGLYGRGGGGGASIGAYQMRCICACAFSVCAYVAPRERERVIESSVCEYESR